MIHDPHQQAEAGSCVPRGDLVDHLTEVSSIKFYSLTFPTMCESIRKNVGMDEFCSHTLLCFHSHFLSFSLQESTCDILYG